MKRIIIAAGATLLAAVPATFGLVGNTSFAQSVPVRVPAHATVLDDHGGQRAPNVTEPGDNKGAPGAHVEPGDDKGALSSHVEPGGDKGALSAHVEPGDDKGGLSSQVELGDDKGALSAHVEPGDDKGGLSAPTPEPSADRLSGSGSVKDDNGGHHSGTSGRDAGSGHR